MRFSGHLKKSLITGLWAASLVPLCAQAGLEPMNDEAMAGVSGRDGLSVDVRGNQLNADGLAWQTDTGGARESNFVHQNATLTGVDGEGITSNGYTIAQTLDAGSDGTQPFLGYTMNMNNVRFSVDDMQMNRNLSNLSTTNPSPRSFGAFAIDAQQARIGFSNTGILDSGSSSATLLGEIVNGKVWYRQLGANDPYLLLNNLQARWEMNNATIGAVGSGSGLDPFNMGGGLVQDAPRIDLELRADWEYGLNDNDFSITGSEVPVFRFGWSGALKDASLIWRGAGGWSGDNWDAPSEGLTFSSRWNYITNDEATAAGEPESEFRWIFGESGGGVQIELGDWQPLGDNAYGHRFPLIAVDALNAGDGPGALCFGGPNPGPLTAGAGCSGADDQQLNLQAGHLGAFDRDTYDGTGTPGGGGAKTDAPSLATFIRDGNLLTVSNKVKLRQDGTQIDQFNWGLIFTLANVDGDMYLYPGGNPGDDSLLGGAGNSLDRGFMIDLLLMSQSFDAADSTTQGFNWDQGTHFMLADTEFETDGAGIGFLASSVLLGANDARFWIKPTPDNPSGNDYYEGGLDILAPQARWNFRGIFGGGSLPNGSEVVQGAYLEANLEGMANLRLSPSDPNATIADDGGSNFLGYSLAMRLGDLANNPDFNMAGGTLGSGQGSFISAAEPARQDVKVTFGDITGDIALTQGVMDLRGPGEEESGSRPSLVISNEILIGQTAAARMNDAVTGHTLPGGGAGQPLVINEVSFSGDRLGRMAVPSGHWGATTKFKPQQ